MAKGIGTVIIDRGYAHARRQLDTLKKSPEVAIGVMGSDAAKVRGSTTMVDIATSHEYGTEHIPERSFIRATVDQNRQKYLAIVKQLKNEVLLNDMPAATALGILGEKIKADIQQRITDGIDPALSQATIDAKKSSVPLIDTGQLRASLTWVVREKKK